MYLYPHLPSTRIRRASKSTSSTRILRTSPARAPLVALFVLKEHHRIHAAGKRGAALYAATLSFPAAYAIRNVTDKSHSPNIDRTPLPKQKSPQQRDFKACREARHVRSQLRLAIFAFVAARWRRSHAWFGVEH
jgi:hypothetical protein